MCLPGVIRLSIHLYLFVLLAPRPKGPSLMCVVLSGCAERVLLRLLVLFFGSPALFAWVVYVGVQDVAISPLNQVKASIDWFHSGSQS